MGSGAALLQMFMTQRNQQREQDRLLGEQKGVSNWIRSAPQDPAEYDAWARSMPAVSDPQMALSLQDFALKAPAMAKSRQDQVTIDDFLKKVDASGLTLPSEMPNSYGVRPTAPELTKDIGMFAADQGFPQHLVPAVVEKYKGLARDAKVENVSGVPRVLDNDALTANTAGGYTAPRDYKTVNDRLGFIGEDGTWQEVPGAPQAPKKAPQTRTRPVGNVDVFEQYDEKTGRWVEVSRSPRWKPGDDGKAEDREYRRKKDAEAAAEREDDNARATYNLMYPVSFMGERVAGAPPFEQWKSTQWPGVRDAGKPKSPTKPQPVQSRFSSDPQMKGNRLGKKLPNGKYQVINAQGKLIGYYE